MTWYQGNTVWYDDCPGEYGGACQDCDDDEYHAAWPYLSTTGCDYRCASNPSRACGASIAIYHACNEVTIWGEIHDCSYMSPNGCWHQPRCDGIYSCPGWGVTITSWWVPFSEITSTYFMDLGADLWCDGRIPTYTWV